MCVDLCARARVLTGVCACVIQLLRPIDTECPFGVQGC